MYGVTGTISGLLGSFRMAEVAMRYSEFVPRFYNLSKSLGFTEGKIMPSRAFCSDESQGYPIILIAKHFGTFPFLSLIHISEPTRQPATSRMPSSA